MVQFATGVGIAGVSSPRSLLTLLELLQAVVHRLKNAHHGGGVTSYIISSP